ncbi:uncharacterized protein K452DRAFT_327015 [Aplosporella prunicola CBS 121167]|uniref:Disintegrin and metalloproteinase domain-containing protein B n=1 Tax=Aplosporella prunicola CBS 121167 TaxID=1176127 RepID=A0A6A6BB80_9PEZI|nr:uncharacterized protein K452DRAFT_327015 [Aplosporella prunicola CBS 121167]KAF2141306.1 hypothetical protein K452DRAFT_327015 [Aplosporella prunicola CBS 121167]
MRLLRAAALAAQLVSTVVASSVARNPLARLEVAQHPEIHTYNHRVTALSTFDLEFSLRDGDRLRLALEPNHDILAEGATVEYLGPDGQVTHREEIDRLAHKVYKGRTWAKKAGTDKWHDKGWARITVRRDGVKPLFEGVLSVDFDHHHIQMASNYMATKHSLDPELEQTDDEYMVLWRDSDIKEDGWDLGHTELKRDLGANFACRSDLLDFNMQPEHPVYGAMMKRDDGFWGAPIGSFFSKRQLDNQGSGNAGGVNLVQTIGDTSGCPTARKVALVGVATDCTYTASFNSTESARQNVINVMNSASDVYESTFNITLGLRNLTVSDPSCPGTQQAATPWNQDCSDSITIQDRLNQFSEWRGTKQDTNSHWTLLTTCNTGSAVGLAWLGQACVQGAQSSNSTSGETETVAAANVVARTNTEWQVIAHETGHTFGAVHDCTSQTCSDGTSVNAQQCCPLSSSTCDAGQRFIMNPSTASGITKFSACSIGNICGAMGRSSVKTSCLSNNRGVTTISGQQCGNGIVEEGEDCDCGGTENCGNNPCCDPKTCKFKSGAVCDDSNEDCCHDCQFASNATVCRASGGVCDPEERCTGDSPYCPSDEKADDGKKCGDGLKCASGQCTSRDLQCKTVMGTTYSNGHNDTYACDDKSCIISCKSPEFPMGMCYSLQQNFLDGTSCGGGGHCQNGQCKGSDLGKEIGSWVDNHKGVVIGVCVAIGCILLFSICGCITRACRRRRLRKFARPAPPVAAAWPGQRPGRRHRGRNDMVQMTPQQPGPGQYPPPPPHGNPWYPPPPPPQYGPPVARYA